jgi:membrane protein DedA with SNARE-associated domain
LIPFFAGSNIVAAVSGVRQTPPAKFLSLLAIGIAGRLALMWWLARTFEDQLVDFLAFLQRYQWWAVGISIALVVVVNARNMRRG